MLKGNKSLYFLLILALIPAACQAPPTTSEPVVETLVVTEVVEATAVETIHVVTPTPEPGGPRTLVICMAGEPESLFPYNVDNNSLDILEASSERTWGLDTNSFSYQPIMLEKLPSLADGDATLTAVTVSEGDSVVDANGEVVRLDSGADPPQMLIPAGGGDTVAYEGGDFQMDQISATFKMLPGLEWSDGTPITSSDSVYAFDWQVDQGGNFLTMRASYEAIDDLTTVWTGLPGYLEYRFFTRFYGPMPEHIWSKYSSEEELQKAEETSRKPLGWGPYIIDEWVSGEQISLYKNPNYFRADEGLPKFDNLIFRFTGENSNANIAALLAGECDIVTSSLDDQIELLLDLQAAGQIKASFTTGTVWEHIDFGIQHIDYDDGYQPGVDRPDFFSDVRTRKAFAHCMDRQRLVDTLLFGQSLILDSYVPPQHPLYNQDLPHYDFDIQAGRAILEEVGWIDDDGDPGTPRIAQDVVNVPDGTILEVAYETTSAPTRQQVTAIIQESLAQCGIKTNIQHYAPSEWFADPPEGKLFGRRFDLGQFAWSTQTDPPCDQYLSNLTPGLANEEWISIQDGATRKFSFEGWEGQNYPGFADDEFDAACNTALAALPGQAEYESAHREAQRIFAEQLPIVPLHLNIKVAAMRPDMCGLIMDPTAISEMWNIEEFDYGEGCEE